MIVDVEHDERYWYPDDGGVVWVAGYALVDPASGRYLPRSDPRLAARGLRIAGVAGAGRHHGAALQGPGASPGRPLRLRRDESNPHDANAIAVHLDAAGDTTAGEQLGWVPRDVAAELARELDRGVAWTAVVLRERRASPREPRSGVTMLLARAREIDLRARG